MFKQFGAGGLADSEGQMAGFAAHGHDKVPARCGVGVHHEILDNLDGDMPGRLKTERRNAIRKIEVIVDGLRHMHNLNAPGHLFLQFERREGRIVSADGHQARDAQPH